MFHEGSNLGSLSPLISTAVISMPIIRYAQYFGLVHSVVLGLLPGRALTLGQFWRQDASQDNPGLNSTSGCGLQTTAITGLSCLLVMLALATVHIMWLLGWQAKRITRLRAIQARFAQCQCPDLMPSESK